MPSLGNTKEGEDVEGRQDWGHQGALGGTMVQDNLRQRFAVKRQCDLTISKKKADPGTESQVEAKDLKDMGQMINMKVVKETLNVKKKEASDMACLYISLDGMHSAEDHISGHVVVVGPELPCREELEASGVQQNSLCNDFLEEFTTALQERDQVICLCNAIIRLPGFGDGDNYGTMPRVVALYDCSIKNGGKLTWRGGMAPFEKLVGDSYRSRY